MPAGDVNVQSAVHSLDQGKFATLIKASMFTALIVVLSLLYIFVQFKGLATSGAMDQAQIARRLADGKGFTTGYIRTAALGMILKKNGGARIGRNQFPGFQSGAAASFGQLPCSASYQKNWKMTPTDIIYSGDRAVAIVAVLFFLLSVGVWYFSLVRLFDPKLALFACASVAHGSDVVSFSLSGLPQMLALFLFSLAILFTLLAIGISRAGKKYHPHDCVGWRRRDFSLGLMTLDPRAGGEWIFIGLAPSLQPFGISGPMGLVAMAALGRLCAA